MDRRREPRFETSQKAVLRVYERDGEIQAVIRNCSGRGLCLELPAPVEPGDTVRIDAGSMLILGEVTYCREAEGRFIAGVEIDQAIDDTAGLARLMRAVLGDPDRTDVRPATRSR